MIFATISDEAGKIQLIEAIKSCTKPHIYRRLLTVQLSAEGKKVSELTSIFKVTPQTIRAFVHAYNQGGLIHFQGHPSDHSCLRSCLQSRWTQTITTS